MLVEPKGDDTLPIAQSYLFLIVNDHPLDFHAGHIEALANEGFEEGLHFESVGVVGMDV